MSFYPLPTVILTDLAQPSVGPVVELGSGDGRFSAVLRDAGAEVVTVDRYAAVTGGSGPDVVATAARLPFRRVRLLVVANLLRHLWDRDAIDRLVTDWINCLAPGGCLYIFEDEPATKPGPADNYRRVQDLLARIVPWRRGLLSRDRFQARLERSTIASGWTNGLRANQFPSPDPSVVLSLLRSDEQTRVTDVNGLVSKIANEGIDYGDYWWTRYERESA
jgi:SAM-dependent methyltransferase